MAPSTFLPNFGPMRLQIWPPGGHVGKKQSAITPELMAGSAPNFYQVYLISIHAIIPRFFCVLLLKVTEVKVQNVAIRRHVSLILIFDLEYFNIVLIGTVYISSKFRPDRTSNIAARWSPWKHTFASWLRGGRIHLWKARVHTTWTNNILSVNNNI
jgi:hypothetical protein